MYQNYQNRAIKIGQGCYKLSTLTFQHFNIIKALSYLETVVRLIFIIVLRDCTKFYIYCLNIGYIIMNTLTDTFSLNQAKCFEDETCVALDFASSSNKNQRCWLLVAPVANTAPQDGTQHVLLDNRCPGISKYSYAVYTQLVNSLFAII